VEDVCLLAVGKFSNTVSGLIQWTLHTVESWCSGLGLSVNTDKIGLVAFTRKRKQGFSSPVGLVRPCNVPCLSST